MKARIVRAEWRSAGKANMSQGITDVPVTLDFQTPIPLACSPSSFPRSLRCFTRSSRQRVHSSCTAPRSSRKRSRSVRNATRRPCVLNLVTAEGNALSAEGFLLVPQHSAFIAESNAHSARRSAPVVLAITASAELSKRNAQSNSITLHHSH